MKKIRLVGLLAFLASLSISVASEAGPIRITSGSAQVGSVSGGLFTFISDDVAAGDLLLTGGMNWGWGDGPYKPGETVTIYVYNSGLDLHGGPGVVDGMLQSYVYYEGFLQFDGSYTVPDVPPGVTTFSTPFVFTGALLGCKSSTITSGCTAGDELFNSTFEGAGNAKVTLDGYAALGGLGTLFDRRSISFDFVATPEPATLLLLGSGLVLLARSYRKKK